MTWRTLVLTMAICACASSVYAEFTLSHGIGMRLEYNDNIYLEHDAEDDVIARVSPNASIRWENPYLTLSLNAGLTIRKYLDHTEEDSIDPILGQPSELDVLFNLYKDLFFLRVTDTFQQVVTDEGGRGGEGNTTVNYTNSNRLRINPYLVLPLAKGTQLQLGYSYENLWYSSSNANDAEIHTYSSTLTQEVSSRITMSLNGSYTLYRPKDPEKDVVLGNGGTYEYDQKSVSVGLAYQATERLHLEGSYGHTWLDYDVRSNSDSDIWSAKLDYEITSTYSVGAAYVKNYTVSVEDGPSDTDLYSAYLKYSDRNTITLSVFSRSSSYVEIDRDTDSYGGELTGEHPFTEKVGVRGLISYANYDESGDDPREYDRYSALLAFYYETRLGRITTGYTYTRNDDADSKDDDYTNNIVFIETSLTF